MALTKAELKRAILRSLKRQGFSIKRGLLALPGDLDKERVRQLHREAVAKLLERGRRTLGRHEDAMLCRVASGQEVAPERMSPRLVEVVPGSEDELFFRYARLHWSIPVSSGYGRRLRFLVEDQSNGKVIGIIGLCDPVYSIGPRDHWIGWSKDAKRNRLQCVMEAFVLGAVPPYTSMLGGKLVAMLVASNEVRTAFRSKYSGRSSYIRRKALDGRLALVTTASALGRSSIYNRLRLQDGPLYVSLGFTSGSGDFQFSNGVYDELARYANRYLKPSAKHLWWGSGFRNRRELVRKCLPRLDLSRELVYHRVRRELFAVPLASNATEFLRCEHSRLKWRDLPANEVFEAFYERWLSRRLKWDLSYREFVPSAYRLF